MPGPNYARVERDLSDEGAVVVLMSGASAGAGLFDAFFHLAGRNGSAAVFGIIVILCGGFLLDRRRRLQKAYMRDVESK